MRARLIIDTDTAGDDVTSLLIGLLHPRAQLEAITICAGNVQFEQEIENALYTVERAGRGHPAPPGRRRRRFAGVAAACLLALVVALPPGLALFLAYPTSRPLWQSPADYGLAYESVAFPSATDGARLSGWYLPAGSDRTIVFAHGLMNGRQAHGRALPLARSLVARGFNVLLFDLRGHGQSQGAPVTLGARETGDVAGAVAFVRGRGTRHVGIVGYSIGAAAGILAAADDPGIEAVVAESAYTSLDRLLPLLLQRFTPLPGWYVGWFSRLYARITGVAAATVSPLQAVPRLAPRPLLLIHGQQDRTIPYAESEALFAAARENPGAELWLIPGARHTHGYEADPAAYTARVVSFLTAYVR